MKSSDVQRAVKVQRFDRAAGDSPSLGHLARVPGTGLPKETRRKKKRSSRRGRHRDRKLRRKVIVVWSAVFAGVAMGILGVALCFALWSKKDRADDAGKANVAEAAETRVVSRFKSPSQEAALDVVKRALLVRDPAMVEEFFRTGSATPEAVAGFLRDMVEVDGPITGCAWQSSMDANGLLLEGVTVNTQVGGLPRNRLALLTPDENGQWKIDFEAFARTAKPAWSEIMALSAGQGLVRVYVAKDHYYNGLYIDETQWTCYGVASPDEKGVLSGYCRQNSPQAAAMERIVAGVNPRSKDKGLRRATLEIVHAEGAESRQFEITRVWAEDWVISATPFDASGK